VGASGTGSAPFTEYKSIFLVENIISLPLLLNYDSR